MNQHATSAPSPPLPVAGRVLICAAQSARLQIELLLEVSYRAALVGTRKSATTLLTELC